MADKTEHTFHIPQQNRRNKLRINTQQQQQQQQNPLPFTHTSSSKHFNPSANVQRDLSLSLSVHHHDDNSNSNFCNSSVLEDYLKERCSKMRSSVPLGPFTGYTSILKQSMFLKPAQQILDDLCGFEFGACSGFSSPLMECLSDHATCFIVNPVSTGGGVEHSWMRSKLVLLLDEVYSRYKLYCQQMQSAVASFETVPGLRNATPYISSAFKAIVKQFSWLKSAILDQLRPTSPSINTYINKTPRPSWSTEHTALYDKKPTHHNPKFIQNSVWRTQRGLPDQAVAVLRTWMFENFLHPYPTDSEKQMLSFRTGLSRTQVSNWFINARVRLWKPMVEEIHMLEEGKAQTEALTHRQIETNTLPNDLYNLSSQGLTSTTRQPIMQTDESTLAKRRKSERDNPIDEEMYKSIYGHTGMLALGLHRNSGVEFTQSSALNSSQPFETDGDRSVESGMMHFG